MYSSPWLDVAVYARAPAADAPIAADIAPGSDSTIRYSHGASSPMRTRSSASTMCVCGEIGYAEITSGRQSATALATGERAFDLATDDLRCLELRGGVRRLRGNDVARRDLRFEARSDGGRDRRDRDDARQRSGTTQQGGVRQGPAEVLARELGRRHRDERSGRSRTARSSRPSSANVRVVLIRTNASCPTPPKTSTTVMQQRQVTDDQHVGLDDQFPRTRPYRPLVDAAERDDGRASCSEPKVGNACAYRPSSNAATERSSAAVTTPCPPRPSEIEPGSRGPPLLARWTPSAAAAAWPISCGGGWCPGRAFSASPAASRPGGSRSSVASYRPAAAFPQRAVRSSPFDYVVGRGGVAGGPSAWSRWRSRWRPRCLRLERC